MDPTGWLVDVEPNVRQVRAALWERLQLDCLSDHDMLAGTQSPQGFCPQETERRASRENTVLTHTQRASRYQASNYHVTEPTGSADLMGLELLVNYISL